MLRAIARAIGEKWWLIGTGILLGFLVRYSFEPTKKESGWNYSAELPAVRPEPEEFDFPLTSRPRGDSKAP